MGEREAGAQSEEPGRSRNVVGVAAAPLRFFDSSGACAHSQQWNPVATRGPSAAWYGAQPQAQPERQGSSASPRRWWTKPGEQRRGDCDPWCRCLYSEATLVGQRGIGLGGVRCRFRATGRFTPPNSQRFEFAKPVAIMQGLRAASLAAGAPLANLSAREKMLLRARAQAAKSPWSRGGS